MLISSRPASSSRYFLVVALQPSAEHAHGGGECDHGQDKRSSILLTGDVVSTPVDRYTLSDVEVVEVHHCAPVYHDVMAFDQVALGEASVVRFILNHHAVRLLLCNFEKF